MQECKKCNSKSIVVEKNYEHWNVYECANCKYWTFSHSDECCKNPHEIITIDHKSNGSFAIYYQCINCGSSPNRKKPLSSKKFGEKIRSEFSNSKFLKFKENKEQERQELAEFKAEYNKQNTKRFKYHIYLTSDKWKQLREKVKERDNFICQKCKTHKAEEVHHQTYDNIYNEKMSDLISVCSFCHIELHKSEQKTV